MDSELDNHINKCRFCFLVFNHRSKSHKISENTKLKFTELIGIELRSSDSYSSIICESCHRNINKFADFQRRLFENQTKLYRHVEQSQNDEFNDSKEVVNFESVNFGFPQIKIEEGVTIKQELVDTEGILMESSALNTPTTSEVPKGYQMCSTCSKIIRNRSFVSHMRTHKLEQLNTPYTCDICEYKSFEKKNLFSHMAVHRSKKMKTFACNFCSLVFSQSSSQRRHERRFHKTKERVYSCECGIVFNSSVNLNAHKKEVHSQSNFPCSDCNFNFPSRVKLRLHFDSHHRPKEACEVCGKLVAPGRSLQRHLQAHAAMKKIKKSEEPEQEDQEVPPGYKLCPFCAKILKVTTINMHIKAHLNQMSNTKFSCDLCGYENFEKKNLASHIVVHVSKDSLKTFTCRYCPEKFTRGTARRRHERRVHEESTKEYRCECGKVFGSQASHYAHRKETHGQGSFICSTCSSEFTTKSKLARHNVRQHETPKIPCQVPGCNHSTRRRSYLAIHYNSHRDIDASFRDELLLQLKSIKMAT